MASGGERENITSENSLMPPLAVFTLPLAFSAHLQCILSQVILAEIIVWECGKIIVSPLIFVFLFAFCICICILYFVERCSCRIMVRGRPALHIAAISASKRWKTANFKRSKPSSLQEMGREANASVIFTFGFGQKCRF